MPRGRKRGTLNKSQAIRDAVGELGGKPRPRDVIEVLDKKGIEVSPALVTNVMARGQRKGRRGRPGRRPMGRNGHAASEKVTVAALIEAKRLVDQVGSVDVAKEALNALAKLI